MTKIVTERHFALSLVIPALIIVIVVVFVPLVYSFYISLTNLHLLKANQARFVGFENYTRLTRDSVFCRALLNTIVFVSLAVNIEFLLGLGLAHLIFATTRGKEIIRTTIMAPMMFAPVLVGFQFKWFFNDQVGLVNNLLCFLTGKYHIIPWLIRYPTNLLCILVAEVWMSTPFMVIVFLAGLVSLPAEPFEAALVDGASGWQRFRYITLPLLGPFIYIAMTIRSLDLGRAYDLVRIMTGGGPANRSEMIWTYTYRLAIENNKFGLGTAASFVSVAISFFFVVYLFTRLLRSRREVY